jgi:hypothetical protein
MMGRKLPDEKCHKTRERLLKRERKKRPGAKVDIHM